MKASDQPWTFVLRELTNIQSNPAAMIPAMTMRHPRGDVWLAAGAGVLAALLGILAGWNGMLAIGLALSIAFLVVALTDLAVGVGLYIFLGFAVSAQFSGLTLNAIQLAPALPLALSWLAQVTRDGHTRPTFFSAHPGVSLLLVLLIGWATMSIAWAEYQGLAATAAMRWTLAAALIPIVFTAIRTKRDLRVVMIAIVAGATLAAMYGLVQGPQPVPGLQNRITGTLGDPNQLASAMVVGITLAGGLIATARFAPGKALGAFVILVCLFALFLTASRGGLIAIGVVLLLSVLLARGRRLALTFVAFVAVIGAIGWITAAAPEETRDRILNPGGGSGRTDIWAVGGRMVEANPVQGVGGGNFPVATVHYLLQPGAIADDQFIVDTPQVAHNMYLEVLAELGIPGALMFLAVIVFSLSCYLKAMNAFRLSGDRELSTLTLAVTLALFGVLTADVFLSEEYSRTLWFFLGLGPALLAMARQGDGSAQSGAARR